jgi:ferredoxin
VTPFGLRRRLKDALGLGDAARAASRDEDTVRLDVVLPDGSAHAVRCEPRYTLVMATQTLDTPIATGCPDGQCGGCHVDVLSGGDALVAPTAAEQRLLAEKHPGRADVRLACHAKIAASGAKVRVHSVWTMESTRGEA